MLKYLDSEMFGLAYPALEEGLPLVGVEMLFLVRHLIKLFGTSVDWARKRLL
jgi:hypothetical protein